MFGSTKMMLNISNTVHVAVLSSILLSSLLWDVNAYKVFEYYHEELVAKPEVVTEIATFLQTNYEARKNDSMEDLQKLVGAVTFFAVVRDDESEGSPIVGARALKHVDVVDDRRVGEVGLLIVHKDHRRGGAKAKGGFNVGSKLMEMTSAAANFLSMDATYTSTCISNYASICLKWKEFDPTVNKVLGFFYPRGRLCKSTDKEWFVCLAELLRCRCSDESEASCVYQAVVSASTARKLYEYKRDFSYHVPEDKIHAAISTHPSFPRGPESTPHDVRFEAYRSIVQSFPSTSLRSVFRRSDVTASGKSASQQGVDARLRRNSQTRRQPCRRSSRHQTALRRRRQRSFFA